jgi:hypothetical protein
MSSSKIFCIGLPKTGTSSLHAAFQILNIPSLHNPMDLRLQAYHGEYNFKSEVNWRALCNFGENFYKQLDKTYPGSKFILTIRDHAKWLPSIERQISRSPGWGKFKIQNKWSLNPLMSSMFGGAEWKYHMSNALVRIEIFGTCVYNKEQMLAIYQQHYKNVIEYFKDRADFLVMNIESGDGWNKLCSFLDIEVPDGINFPHTRPNPS